VFCDAVQDLSIWMNLNMSWTVMCILTTRRSNRHDMGESTGCGIMTVHFDRVRTQDWNECELLRGCELNSMRAIPLSRRVKKPTSTTGEILTKATRVLSAVASSSSGTNRICCNFSANPPVAGSRKCTSPVGPPAEYTCVYGNGMVI